MYFPLEIKNTCLIFIILGCVISCTNTSMEPKPDPNPNPKDQLGEAFTKENSPLLENYVYEIEVDREDKLWIVMDDVSELANFDGENWDFVSLPDSLGSPSISSIAFDNTNSIWIAADPYGIGGVLLTYNGKEWTKYDKDIPIKDSKHFRITSVAIDSADNIWIGTNRGLVYFDRRKWDFYTQQNSNLNNNSIYDLAFDSNNKLWLTTSAGSISNFDGDNFNFYNFQSYGYANHGSRTLVIDNKNTKWMDPSYKGLARFTIDDMYVFDTNNSALPANYIETISIDKNQDIWAAFPGFTASNHANASLIHMISEDEWMLYTMENSNLPHFLMRDIATDMKGNIWVGTLGGLFKVNINEL